MSFTAAEVMQRAATTLGDENSVRWTAQELHRYLNDGLQKIVELKPNARSETVVLTMVAGTKQTLPDQYTVLSRVQRNLTDTDEGAGAIRTLDSKSVVDAMLPGWQDESVIPHVRKVEHVIHDLADPNTFYVVPGNDGTGRIEAVVGVMPTASPVPGSPGSVASYTDNVDIHDIYKNALTDYVLYRAFSKDARVAGVAARSVAHLELFNTAITGFANAEGSMALASHAGSTQQAREA